MQIRPPSQTFSPTGFFATGYKVYIGLPFRNPLQAQNQVDIFDGDSATGATVSQPLKIGSNGSFQNDKSQTVNPVISANSYSISVVSPAGVVDPQYSYANIESDVISGIGTNVTIVDQVFDYLALAQTSDLSEYTYIFVRSELDAPLDPENSRYFHADGTTGTPSSGDINQFYDSTGKGFSYDNEQRVDLDLFNTAIKEIRVTVFDASDPAWVPDTNTQFMDVELIGGGGGGGSTSDLPAIGGGGGGGAMMKKLVSIIDPTYAITIGAGGPGGDAGGNTGDDGGLTTILSDNLDLGAGGGFGGSGANTTNTTNVEDGGNGGLIDVGDDFDEGYYGPPGESGIVISGTVANYGNGRGFFGNWNQNDVDAAFNAGGGGNGSDILFGGGNGADGRVIIKEYIS